MDFVQLYTWIGLTFFFLIIFILQFMFLLFVVAKKTHAIVEFKSAMKGNPIALFFQSNKYCEWRNTKPDAGMVEDKEYGAFIISDSYIDKTTKNVLVPFNSDYAISLNVKAAKLADELTHVYKDYKNKMQLKQTVMKDEKNEQDGHNVLRTSVDFSNIKSFVSPILPHNIQSKITKTVFKEISNMNKTNMPNAILLTVTALGALALSGLIIRYVVMGG